MKQEQEKTHGRRGPQFPGPIGNQRAGVQARMSFIGADGKRQWHSEAVHYLTREQGKSLLTPTP